LQGWIRAPRARYATGVDLPVFVYGTLLLAEIQRLITGKVFPSRPATLFGYRRGLVRGETYPSVEPDEGSTVEGLLLSGVDANSLRRLDAYEGQSYVRIQVPVRDETSGQLTTCWLWRLRPEVGAEITREAFDLALFVQRDLPAFLRGYPGLDPDSRPTAP
jgi:gamma-glutamylcyclotransferase (GGCT)/AIG2-like uncharacterized protein YtfP